MGIPQPMEEGWYAHPQLFFACHLRPKDGREPKKPTYKSSPDDIEEEVTLVFFSTFDQLTLPIKGPMEEAGVLKLYEPSPTSCVYMAPARNLLGRVLLIPLFLG